MALSWYLVREGRIVDGSEVKGSKDLASLTNKSVKAVNWAKYSGGYVECGNGAIYLPKPKDGELTDEDAKALFRKVYPLRGQLVCRGGRTGKVTKVFYSHKYASESCPSVRAAASGI